jgi:hypothetical protein
MTTNKRETPWRRGIASRKRQAADRFEQRAVELRQEADELDAADDTAQASA